MKRFLTEILLALISISLTSCSLVQRSEQQVMTTFAEAVARHDMATICDLASNEFVCSAMWQPLLHGQHARGEFGAYTIHGDRICYEGGAGIRVQLNRELRIMQLYHIPDCHASIGHR